MSRKREPAGPLTAYKRARLTCEGRRGSPHKKYLLAEVGFHGQTTRESMMRSYEAAHGYEDGEDLGFDTEEFFPLYTMLKKSHDLVETLPDGSRKIRLKCQTCNRDLQLKEERFMKLLYGLDEADPLKPSHSIDIAHIPG